MTVPKYTTSEMMAIALSRQVEDGKCYIVGTGLPLIGATLAKNTNAPGATLLFESGILEGIPQEVPAGVSDLRACHGASVLWPQFRYFGYQTLAAKRELIEAGFIGGAQIDPYGNVNSTCIGDYRMPSTRFSGSGGANGIATYFDTIIIMKHEKRRFVQQVDYVTSPGWIDGPAGRASLGLDPTHGPRTVITELGILRFGSADKRMFLSEYFPGVTPRDIATNTDFALDLSRAEPSIPPTEAELRALRSIINPGFGVARPHKITTAP